MCYDVSYQLKKLERYARLRGIEEEEIEETLSDLKKKIKDPTPVFFHLSGFQHEPLPVYTNDSPYSLQFYNWGLVPQWANSTEKANKIRTGTLNARCETLFEKASFKNAIRKNRCLIMIDGFFEHYHLKGKTFPFYISHADDSPMMLAGIYEKSVVEGIEQKTVSIVTTKANALMSKIHNNPKLDEPRMPVILHKEFYNLWLFGEVIDEENNEIDCIFEPYPDDLLKAHTVSKLRDGRVPVNNEDATQEFTYPELPLGVQSIPMDNNQGQISLF